MWPIMKFLTSLASLAALVATTAAWSFTVNTAENWCGANRGYFSSHGDNQCYNFSDDVAGKVHSFTWCSMPFTRCSITMHSKAGCGGNILGSATAAYPTIWEKTALSAAGSKMMSFKVQGCFLLSKLLDVTNCYNGVEPWNEARFCNAKRGLTGWLGEEEKEAAKDFVVRDVEGLNGLEME